MTCGPINRIPAGLQWMDVPLHPLTIQLYDYWRGKAADRAMPDRTDIDPIEIPRLLPNILLVDSLTAEGDFRVRLFGSELAYLTGEERTGTGRTEIGRNRAPELAQKTQERWKVVITRLVNEQAPLFLRTRMDYHADNHRVLHIAALPLSAGTPGVLAQGIGMMVMEA